MSFDLDKILRSKRKFRQRLAALPIVEKLAMLDAMRERELAIRPARAGAREDSLREQPPAYQARRKSQNEGQTRRKRMD